MSEDSNYGDNHNWFAAWALWILKYYRHRDVRLLNGGRMKWLADRREMTSALPSYPRTTYSAQPPQSNIRAFRDQILSSLGRGSFTPLDVRSPGEFSGELRAIYEGKGITPDEEVIAYCRIGERSSHTWFVLHYLLGYPGVRNYDGSWTEWGSLIGVPIEK